ncbi:hypothetical protein JKP88DRAFT_332876 [Tribonema minus]|uniref:Thioredoxin domain-containing protein n=1 Tax=Tribonema minus TaxID=303371 RepID=A0A836C9X9_9STRA|nr:hypothetical protein JKP88DRAFT_332876 [Tribonema minus]
MVMLMLALALLWQQAFLAAAAETAPVLSAGHFNLTAASYAAAVRKQRGGLLVGFASPACEKCAVLEPEYEAAAQQLKAMGVPLARVNTEKERHLLASVATETSRPSLPCLLFHDPPGRASARASPVVYKGAHSANDIVEFVRKQLASPSAALRNAAAVDAFLERGGASGSVTRVLGLFSDGNGMEDDDLSDFMDAARELQGRADIYFGHIDDALLAREYVGRKGEWPVRTPAVALLRPGMLEEPLSIHLDTLADAADASLSDWILRSSVPTVGRLTHGSFGLYERLGLPMLIMLLDLEGGLQAGSSGGLPNSSLLAELEAVALELRGRMSFVYADGVAFSDSMRSLGLFGTRQDLPQLAVNTRDARRFPFPHALPVNRETLGTFCGAFLSGRLKEGSADAATALQPAKKSRTNARQNAKGKVVLPGEVPGIAEQFREEDAVVEVTALNFDAVAMREDRDVLLLFHQQESEACAHIIPHYKRVGLRFAELSIATVTIARMDVTAAAPPATHALTLPPLPAILLLPADDKGPPYRFYSGKGKTAAIMQWLQQHASRHFELPPVPHLSGADRVLYYKQLKQREEMLQQRQQQQQQQQQQSSDGYEEL